MRFFMKNFLFIFFTIPSFIFANLSIQKTKNGYLEKLSFGNFGSVVYVYEKTNLKEVQRFNKDGLLLYLHSYIYDENDHLAAEKLPFNLGTVYYKFDKEKKVYRSSSPYHDEVCFFDENNLLVKRTIDDETKEYSYDDNQNLLTSDQRSPLRYDAEGNLISNGTYKFSYHSNHLLYKVEGPNTLVYYFYDESGARSSRFDLINRSKMREHYLNLDKDPIAILDEKANIKELRIPGLSPDHKTIRAIAIESPKKIMIPIHDYQGNIIKLIQPFDEEVISLEFPDPYGKHLSLEPTSWTFAGKHYDPETNLVYFGSRYYDITSKTWLTPDPMGTLQSDDLYQYCLYNPLKYYDPDGEFVFAIPLVWLGGAALGKAILTGAAIFGTAWLGNKVILEANKWARNESTKKDLFLHRKNFEYEKHLRKTTHYGLMNVPSWENDQFYAQNPFVLNKTEVRTEPKNLEEQLALEEAKNKQSDSDDEIMENKINDPKYPKEEWRKIQHLHKKPDGNNINIHYWQNKITGTKHEFKFKNE